MTISCRVWLLGVALVGALSGCPTSTDRPVDAGALADDGLARDAGAMLDTPEAPGADASLDGGSLDASGDAGALDASGDAGAGDGSGDGSVTADTAAAPRAGLASLSQGSFSGTPTHTLFGIFGPLSIDDLRRGLVDPTCTVAAEAGACRRISCPAVIRDTDAAGTLRAAVSGADVAMAAAPTPGTGPYVSGGAGLVFAAGQTVTISGSGGLVPAFTADVVAPSMPSMTFPTTAPRTTDLALSWTSSGEGTMQVSIISAGGGDLPIVCLVPATAGALLIDASLLSAIAAGTVVQITASHFATMTVTAGLYTIDVSVAQGLSGVMTLE